jgi:cyd operon protein YbgE
MLLALILSGLLLINPGQIADSTAQLKHGYLSLLMLALSGAFIHGVGFNPRFWLWKIIFSPYLSWTILITFVISIFA